MLAQGQTLRHKETNSLVSIVPRPQGTNHHVWHWPNKNGYTQFYNKCGGIFVDKISNYTHIEDEFGRAVCGRVKEGEFVDTSLERFLVSERELAELRQKSLVEWEERVLKKLEESDHVYHPFSDSSHCSAAEEYFLEKHNALPLHKTYDGFKKAYTLCYGQYVMKIRGKTWMYIRSDGMRATSLEYLQEVIKSLTA